METLVYCPDCGGVIGGRSPEGVKLCTCETKPPEPASAPTYKPSPLPGRPYPAPEAEKPKLCCCCGKDLHGRKRFKDKMGYWCEACHFSEKKQEMKDHVPCDGCGRYVEKHHLGEYEGLHLCSRCVKERQRQGKKLRRPIVFGSEHAEHEKRTLMTLVIAAAALLLIIVMASLGWLPNLL